MIYEHRLYNVKSRKMEELKKIAGVVLPRMEKYGAKFIGAWTTEIGHRDTHIAILAFEDLPAREKAWKEVLQDKEIQALFAGEPVLDSSYISILTPTEYSPLK